MAVEIDAIQSAKSIGWSDALLSRLAANSVGFGARLSITAPANASALSSTGYSLTGSNAQSMIDLAGTLNTTGSPAIIKVAMSNTASGATTKFLSLLAGAAGATEVFSIDKAGLVIGAYGYFPSGMYVGGTTVGTATVSIGNTAGEIFASASGFINWNNDTYIRRDGAANTLALRNAANAQAFNIYGTYTSASVYERGAVYADSNGFNIAHQQLGATKRPVRILGHNLDSAEAVSALEINQTWNTTGNPVALKLAITNAASGATSKFVSFLAGASGTTEVFSVDKAGSVEMASGAVISNLQYIFFGSTNSSAATVMSVYGLILGGTIPVSWRSGGNGTAVDLSLYRDAANTLALRNAANAQAFNIYNTYTSGSVYERMFARYSVANTRFEIGTEHTGASARDIAISRNGTSDQIVVKSSEQIFQVASGYSMYWNSNGLYSFNSPRPLGTLSHPWSDIHLRPSSSLTPSANGDLCIEATNNTTLTFRLKGSDGTVRSGTVTLA